MAMDPIHLRKRVIRPGLEAIGLYSPAAEELVLGTAGVESQCGTFLEQLGGGPALGIFQMERITFEDMKRWAGEAGLLERLNAISVTKGGFEELAWNLLLAAAYCRVKYRTIREALPAAGDIPGQAAYWKKYYNTRLGSGKVEDYVRCWNRYS